MINRCILATNYAVCSSGRGRLLSMMDHIIITKPCTVQDWATAMRARTDSANHHMAIDALAALLDDKASPFNAAEKITMAYGSSLKALNNPDDSGNDISKFYALYLCDAIRTFGDASGHMVDLLVEISKRPDAKHVKGASVKHRNGSVYWRDLPGWSYNFLEYGLRESPSGPSEQIMVSSNSILA